MGRQSSRIYFQQQDHKGIYFNSHYHDKMYLGDALIWEKFNGLYIIYITHQNGYYYAILADGKNQKTGCYIASTSDLEIPFQIIAVTEYGVNKLELIDEKLIMVALIIADMFGYIEINTAIYNIRTKEITCNKRTLERSASSGRLQAPKRIAINEKEAVFLDAGSYFYDCAVYSYSRDTISIFRKDRFYYPMLASSGNCAIAKYNNQYIIVSRSYNHFSNGSVEIPAGINIALTADMESYNLVRRIITGYDNNNIDDIYLSGDNLYILAECANVGSQIKKTIIVFNMKRYSHSAYDYLGTSRQNRYSLIFAIDNFVVVTESQNIYAGEVGSLKMVYELGDLSYDSSYKLTNITYDGKNIFITGLYTDTYLVLTPQTLEVKRKKIIVRQGI